MIKVNLKQLMEINNINTNQLAKKTGLSRKAITLLANYNETETQPVSVQYNTLEVLCSFFKVGINDLIQYVYNENDFEVIPLAFDIGKNKDITLLMYSYRNELNKIEHVNYFLVAVRLEEHVNSEKRTYSVPTNLFKNDSEKKFEEQVITTPTIKKYSFEIIDYDDIDKTYQYISTHPLFEMIKENEVEILNNIEINTLMASFSKSFLAKLTSFSFDYLLEETENEESIIINWNFGEYSWQNSDKFHFEYSKINNTIMSLDDDNIFNNNNLFGKIDNEHVKPNTYSL